MPPSSFLGFLRAGQGPNYRDFEAFDGRIDVLSIRSFSYIQRRQALHDVWVLAERCWFTYRDALRLVEPGAPFPARFESPFDPDLRWLLLAYDRLCIWYREALFGLQLDLFECNFALEINRWMHFRESCCFKLILQEPHSVRATLEASGFLPSLHGTQGEYREFDTLINHWKERNTLPCLPTTPFPSS